MRNRPIVAPAVASSVSFWPSRISLKGHDFDFAASVAADIRPPLQFRSGTDRPTSDTGNPRSCVAGCIVWPVDHTVAPWYGVVHFDSPPAAMAFPISSSVVTLVTVTW